MLRLNRPPGLSVTHSPYPLIREVPHRLLHNPPFAGGADSRVDTRGTPLWTSGLIERDIHQHAGWCVEGAEGAVFERGYFCGYECLLHLPCIHIPDLDCFAKQARHDAHTIRGECNRDQSKPTLPFQLVPSGGPLESALLSWLEH